MTGSQAREKLPHPEAKGHGHGKAACTSLGAQAPLPRQVGPV